MVRLGTKGRARPIDALATFFTSATVCGLWSAAARAIDLPGVEAGGEEWEVGAAIVCTGHDFETLYPNIYSDSGLTRCKLH